MTSKAIVAALVAVCTLLGAGEARASDSEKRTIKARVQPRPGAEVQDIEMEIHRVPTELTLMPADSVELDDDDLIVGVVHEGFVAAYPIRFLAQYEIVGDNLNGLPIAPSW